MNKQLENNDSAHGSAQEWDAIWKEVGTKGNSRAKAFTRSNPKDIFQFWQRCYFEDLVLTMKPQPSWAFLELASGRGTTSMYLVSYGFHDVTMLDLSDTALEQAKTNFASENLPLPSMVVGNAEATGLPADSFDCIFNIGVLEHFEDPTKILAEALRLLKPGGKVFMPIVPTMPFSHSILCRLFLNPVSLAKHMIKMLIGRSIQPKNTTMVRTTTGATEYEKVAKEVGFQSVSCMPYNPYWKLYSDESAFGTFLTLPIYRGHHAIKRGLGCIPSLKTASLTSLCLLLTATK